MTVVRVFARTLGPVGFLKHRARHGAFVFIQALLFGEVPYFAQGVGEGLPTRAGAAVGRVPEVQLLFLERSEQQAGQLVDQTCDGVDLHGQVDRCRSIGLQRQEVLAVNVGDAAAGQRLTREHRRERFDKRWGAFDSLADHLPLRADHHRQVGVDIQRGIQLFERRAQCVGGHFTGGGASGQLGEQFIGRRWAVVIGDVIGHAQLLCIRWPGRASGMGKVASAMAVKAVDTSRRNCSVLQGWRGRKRPSF